MRVFRILPVVFLFLAVAGPVSADGSFTVRVQGKDQVFSYGKDYYTNGYGSWGGMSAVNGFGWCWNGGTRVGPAPNKEFYEGNMFARESALPPRLRIPVTPGTKSLRVVGTFEVPFNSTFELNRQTIQFGYVGTPMLWAKFFVGRKDGSCWPGLTLQSPSVRVFSTTGAFIGGDLGTYGMATASESMVLDRGVSWRGYGKAKVDVTIKLPKTVSQVDLEVNGFLIEHLWAAVTDLRYGSRITETGYSYYILPTGGSVEVQEEKPLLKGSLNAATSIMSGYSGSFPVSFQLSEG